MSESPVEESWESKLKKDIADYEDVFEHGLALTIEQFLCSEITAVDAVKKIDEVYEELSQADPLMKYEDDKGMAGFLWGFYDVVINFASLVPHDNECQDRLIQLLQELMRQPTKKAKIWKVRFVQSLYYFTITE